MPNEKEEEIIKEEEEQNNEEEVTQEEEEEKEEEQKPDYDAELSDRKDSREHNKKNAERRLENKKLDEETTGDVKEVIKEAMKEMRSEESASYVNDLIHDELSRIENPAERELVKDYYHNTIRQSGTSKSDIERDILHARTLANQPRVTKENSEMKVAMRNRAGISNDSQGSSSEEKPQHEERTKWTPEQLENFKVRGITPEEVEATQRKIAGQ